MKYLKLPISALLLAWLASRTDWGHVADAFGRLRLELWLMALGLYSVIQVISGWRWKLLAGALGFRRPLSHFVGIYYIGMFFNLVLPTSVGGDVVRAWYLDNRSGCRTLALLSVLADRGSGLAILLALACLASLFAPMKLPAWIPWSIWSAAGLAMLIGAGTLLRMKRSTSSSSSRLRQAMCAYLERPGVIIGSTLLSILVQSGNVVLVWLVGLALAAPVPTVYYWMMVPMVTLLTLIPISLNGMGIREGGTVLFLTPLGVSEGTALTLAFLWFAVMAVNSLAGGLVYLLGRFPRPSLREDHGPVGDHSDQGRTSQLATAA